MHQESSQLRIQMYGLDAPPEFLPSSGNKGDSVSDAIWLLTACALLAH